MNYLNAENLSKSYSEKALFENISISLSENQKTALIAANGSGKSTILKILAGKEIADSGNVVYRRDVAIGYLDQHPYLHDELTIKENLFQSEVPALRLIGEYELLLSLSESESALQQVQDDSEGESESAKRMHELIEQIDNLKAWDIETRAAEILGRLNLHDLNVKAKLLSGGERKRVALAKLLIEEPDLLLLDEPTNHLDLDMIEWLENYLRRLNKTLLLITHDRYFLDAVCDTILELENGKLYQYNGNYAYFLEKKQEREMMLASESEKVKNLYNRELEWMRRQPKARTTKQKARIDSFAVTEEKNSSYKIEEKRNITMQMQRMGSKILELENVCKSYGDKILLKDFSYTFKRGEKIGIIGKNGSGKSTLLKMIMQQVKPDLGRIKTGDTIEYGYYSQDGLVLKEDKRVLEVMKDIAEYVDTGNGSYLNMPQFLTFFKFDYNKQHTFVSKLSGGERRRLYLLTILVKNPNFLILDEPTNDLDIVTLNLLEEFLLGFGGCLLLVTHDRYFMDRLVDHVFVFTDSGIIRDIHGNYTEYRNMLDVGNQKSEVRSQKSEVGSKKSEVGSQKSEVNSSPQSLKRKLSFKEKHEFELLEKELAALEERKKFLLEKMSSGNLNHDDMKQCSNEFQLLEKTLDAKTNRWLELAELVG